MTHFILPVIITMWVIIFNHNIRKRKDTSKQDTRTLMQRESDANSVRRKDISNLPYIDVPLKTFPLDITLNDEKKQLKISEYSKELRLLSDKKMLNLIGVTNTELKELYGPANLETLSICDQHYSRYIRTLHLLAECIYEEYPEQAVSLWEYCLSIGTDISGTFDMLGQHYLKTNNTEKFKALYDQIPDKNSISGKTILHKLDALKEPFFF